jgi:hypothetical protein
MNFTDAFNNMLAGRRLYRDKWDGNYITIIKGQNYIWNIAPPLPNMGVPATVYTPTIADLQANDWNLKLMKGEVL